LQDAEDAGQRAWIVGHIPPGSTDTIIDQSNYYDQIIQRYQKTVAAQFFGHTHIDQFQIAYSDYENQISENAVSFAMVAPSLTPTNGNPAFTVYDVDPDTYNIMDKRVYIANMTEPSYHTQPEWSLLYSARDSYGRIVADAFPSTTNDEFEPSAPLDAPFWHKLTEVFLSNQTVFDMYVNRTNRNAVTRRRCEEGCRNRTICDIRAMRSQDNCYNKSLKEIIYPDPDGPDVSDACEGSAFPSIMRRLLGSVQGDV